MLAELAVRRAPAAEPAVPCAKRGIAHVTSAQRCSGIGRGARCLQQPADAATTWQQRQHRRRAGVVWFAIGIPVGIAVGVTVGFPVRFTVGIAGWFAVRVPGRLTIGIAGRVPVGFPSRFPVRFTVRVPGRIKVRLTVWIAGRFAIRTPLRLAVGVAVWRRPVRIAGRQRRRWLGHQRCRNRV